MPGGITRQASCDTGKDEKVITGKTINKRS